MNHFFPLTIPGGCNLTIRPIEISYRRLANSRTAVVPFGGSYMEVFLRIFSSDTSQHGFVAVSANFRCVLDYSPQKWKIVTQCDWNFLIKRIPRRPAAALWFPLRTTRRLIKEKQGINQDLEHCSRFEWHSKVFLIVAWKFYSLIIAYGTIKYTQRNLDNFSLKSLFLFAVFF